MMKKNYIYIHVFFFINTPFLNETTHCQKKWQIAINVHHKVKIEWEKNTARIKILYRKIAIQTLISSTKLWLYFYYWLYFFSFLLPCNIATYTQTEITCFINGKSFIKYLAISFCNKYCHVYHMPVIRSCHIWVFIIRTRIHNIYATIA